MGSLHAGKNYLQTIQCFRNDGGLSGMTSQTEGDNELVHDFVYLLTVGISAAVWMTRRGKKELTYAHECHLLWG